MRYVGKRGLSGWWGSRQSLSLSLDALQAELDCVLSATCDGEDETHDSSLEDATWLSSSHRGAWKSSWVIAVSVLASTAWKDWTSATEFWSVKTCIHSDFFRKQHAHCGYVLHVLVWQQSSHISYFCIYMYMHTYAHAENVAAWLVRQSIVARWLDFDWRNCCHPAINKKRSYYYCLIL